MTEYATHEFKVKGKYTPDTATVTVLTSITATGKSQAQIQIGKVTSSLEWFWSEKGGPSNPSFIPSNMGLARSRYDSDDSVVSPAPLADGGVLLLTRQDRALVRLDRSLRRVWLHKVDDEFGTDFSPPWTSSILFLPGGGTFIEISPDGRRHREGYYYDEVPKSRTERTPIRVAAGQDQAGEWLIVNY